MTVTALSAARLGSVERVPGKLFQFAFLFFVASFFLKLGSDTLEQPVLRIAYLVFLTLGLLLTFSQSGFPPLLQSPTVVLFLLFLGFEVTRMAWATWQMGVKGTADSLMLPLNRYLASPVTWSLYIGFFLISFFLFRRRNETQRLLWMLAGCGFFLAVVAIPPLLIKGLGFVGYAGPSGRISYFPPFFYFHPVVGKYLIASYANSNYIGDVVAMGFFPALGVFLYRLQQKKSFTSLALPGLFVATEGLAVILFFSRSTIVCFGAAFAFFLLLALLKFPSRIQFAFSGLAFLLVVGFFLWAGNVNKTWKELQTLQGETSESTVTSFWVNREGIERSIAIYRTFPVWGVGTRGYESVSDLYATVGVSDVPMASFKAFCHYLQTLAEEGAGAFLYFLFLAVYVLEAGWKLFRTKSRFQFMAGLSLYSVALMILAHATGKPVMDYFAIAAPVYVLMGATLALLASDFEHA